MKDRELDNLIKEALNSDEVPSILNEALMKKIQKKRGKAKIYTFVKFGSAVAAMFICAVAVLTHFETNPNINSQPELPAQKQADTKKAADNVVANKISVPDKAKAKASEKEASETNTKKESSPKATQRSTYSPQAKRGSIPAQTPAQASVPAPAQSYTAEAEAYAESSCYVSIESRSVNSDRSLFAQTQNEPASITVSDEGLADRTEAENPEANAEAPLPEDSIGKADEEPTADNKQEEPIDEQQALQIAKDACTVPYTDTEVFLNSETQQWEVRFYTEGIPGGDQSILIDQNGVVQKTEYGE